KPRRLRPSRCDWPKAAKFTRGLGEPRGFCEELRPPGVATASSHQCENAECPDARHGRRAMNSQDRLGRVGCLAPAPLTELEAAAQRAEVEHGQLDAPLLGVVESFPQVTRGLPIAAFEQVG